MKDDEVERAFEALRGLALQARLAPDVPRDAEAREIVLAQVGSMLPAHHPETPERSWVDTADALERVARDFGVGSAPQGR